MSRQVETGTTVIDSFPVFEDDGYTTKSGLLPTDFDTTVLFDGTILALPVSIEEIETSGQYKVEFTPPVDGRIQIASGPPRGALDAEILMRPAAPWRVATQPGQPPGEPWNNRQPALASPVAPPARAAG